MERPCAKVYILIDPYTGFLLCDMSAPQRPILAMICQLPPSVCPEIRFENRDEDLNAKSQGMDFSLQQNLAESAA